MLQTSTWVILYWVWNHRSESWSPKSHVSTYLNELELWLNIQEEPFKRKRKKGDLSRIWGRECLIEWLKFSKFCLLDANSTNFIPQVHRHTVGLCFLFSKVWRPSPRQSWSLEGETMKFALNSKLPGEWLEVRSQPKYTKSNHEGAEILD